jgi:hypothetical protein
MVMTTAADGETDLGDAEVAISSSATEARGLEPA